MPFIHPFLFYLVTTFNQCSRVLYLRVTVPVQAKGEVLNPSWSEGDPRDEKYLFYNTSNGTYHEAALPQVEIYQDVTLSLDWVVTGLTALTLLLLSSLTAVEIRNLRESYSPCYKFGFVATKFVVQFVVLALHVPPPFASQLLWDEAVDSSTGEVVKYYYFARVLNIYMMIRMYTLLYLATSHCHFGTGIPQLSWARLSIKFKIKILITSNPALLLAPMAVITIAILCASLLFAEGQFVQNCICICSCTCIFICVCICSCSCSCLCICVGICICIVACIGSCMHICPVFSL